MNEGLTVVVLAGGIGKRFAPFTTDKLLFPFFGKPFIEHTIGSSLPREATKVVLITNTANKQAFASLKLPVPHITVVQSRPLGMADALTSAAAELKDAPILILIADDLVAPSLYEQVLHTAHDTNAFGVIPGWKTPAYFPGGYMKLEGDRIRGIVEKPGDGKTPSPYVVISGHYIKNAEVLLAEIRAARSTEDDIYEKAITKLMAHEEFRMLPYEGTFTSLKYPWDVLGVQSSLFADHFKAKKGKGVVIKQNVTIEGDVYLDDGVKVFENTKIVGPCYIGKNTIIGNNNIIRESHIGADCVTGFNTDITRSYVGDNCWFHSNYIGDSVLEAGISMGGGAALANLRLDDGEISSVVNGEKKKTKRNKLGAMVGVDASIGVNASIMPGVKIGARTFVGSGVVLDRDLPADVFCTATGGYTVKPKKETATVSRKDFKSKI